jgi:hypothetical protein
MASKLHMALAASIIKTQPNRKTKRFRDELAARREVDRSEAREPMTAQLYRMTGTYVPYMRGGGPGRAMDIDKVAYKL